MIEDHSSKRTSIDYVLALTVFVLIVFGLIMIYSSSVILSHEQYGGEYHFLIEQAISLGIGIGAWILFQSLDYHFLKRYSFAFFLSGIILLVLVFIPSIGTEGVSRWIKIGSFSFQPSELVKLIFVIYLASWLSKRKDEIKSFKKGLLPIVFLLALFGGLIVMEPDLGTASILVAVGVSMFYMAGGRLSHIIIILSMIFGAGYLAIINAPYRLQRLLTFLDPQANPTGSGYQLRNALIAIGSGGLFGLGFGNSSQKYLYLPEAHTDSIFAIISEELGFIRAVLVIAGFLILAWRGFLIARNAPDRFGRLLAGGITVWFSLQAFVNIGSMLGLIPLTGLTLPFISYGGTSLVVSLAGVGILLNISKFSNVSKRTTG